MGDEKLDHITELSIVVYEESILTKIKEETLRAEKTRCFPDVQLVFEIGRLPPWTLPMHRRPGDPHEELVRAITELTNRPGFNDEDLGDEIRELFKTERNVCLSDSSDIINDC